MVMRTTMRERERERDYDGEELIEDISREIN